LVRLPAFDPIEFLLEREFPNLRVAWSPGPRRSVPAPDPEKVESYREQLLGMTESELDALVKREREKARVEAAAKAERDEQQLFFNRPEAAADYAHWGRAAFWRCDEAVALALGRSPEIVTWDKVKSYVQVSRFASEFQRLRDLVERAEFMGKLARPMIPRDFLAWAKAIGVSCPDQLVEAVTSVDNQMADWKALYGEAMARIAALEHERDTVGAQPEQKPLQASPGAVDSLRTRERETLLKLIICMAIEGYGHDPSASRTGTARDVVGDLAKNGLSLDEDTVRNWLKKAREVLPGGWRPDNKD
jgi:hypothetical protein